MREHAYIKMNNGKISDDVNWTEMAQNVQCQILMVVILNLGFCLQSLLLRC
jgi:hypothetical protein